MRKGLKRIFIFLLVLITLIGVGLVYFFYSSEAPITKGETIQNIEFKQAMTLDLYQPTQLKYDKSPLVLFFHGGAWIAGSKEVININRYHGAIKRLREDGYAIISANYTLASIEKSPFPASIDDAQDVVLWAQKNADKYKFDLNNMGVFGESAGAHIALLLAYSRAEETDKQLEAKNTIKYVVDVYGPTQLDSLYHMNMVDSLNAIIERVPESVRECINVTQHLFGFDPQEDSLRTLKFTNLYSPLSYIKHNNPPTLIIHGIEDRIVPIEQSQMLLEKLQNAKVPHEYYEIENMDHAFRGANKQQKEFVQLKIYDFIVKHYEN